MISKRNALLSGTYMRLSYNKRSSSHVHDRSCLLRCHGAIASFSCSTIILCCFATISFTSTLTSHSHSSFVGLCCRPHTAIRERHWKADLGKILLSSTLGVFSV